MSIPDFQSYMLPVLKFAIDGTVHTLAEAREVLAQTFKLSDEERNELLPSGRQRRFDNRVAWAKVYLEQAELISSPRRAHFMITDRGRALLSENPPQIDITLLGRYSEFQEFRNASRNKGLSNGISVSEDIQTISSSPEELLETAYQSIRAELASDLLSRVKAASPTFFETLVIDL